jgi:hypothetical protein
MVVTDSTVVVNVEPRDISPETFRNVQAARNSPATSHAHAGYQVVANNRVSIAFALAVFGHESQYATDPGAIVVKHQTNNPGNCRSPRLNASWPVIDTARGPFVDYPSWEDGWSDLAFRLVDPNYVYVKEGRRTIRQIIERFAPAEDGNAPEHYITAVVEDMNRWIENAPTNPMPARPIHVALSAGHHNTSGGNATEIKQTGPLTVAIAKACRARGMDVRVIQSDDGMGNFPGSLSAAAAQVVEWDRSGWTVDVFLENHTEGSSGTRGAFAIYPDWSPDIDGDVRDVIGPAIVKRLQASTGMPIRRIGAAVGVMSERQTGVGAQGDRLGVFRVTESLRDHTTRMIVEFGAHDNNADLAIFNAPGFLDAAGRAVADSFADFYDVPPPAPVVDEFWVPGASYPYVLGFAGHVRRIGAAVSSDAALGALAVFGLPQEHEYAAVDGCSYQRTERYVLQWQPGVQPPFDITGLHRGAKIPEKKPES